MFIRGGSSFWFQWPQTQQPEQRHSWWPMRCPLPLELQEVEVAVVQAALRPRQLQRLALLRRRPVRQLQEAEVREDSSKSWKLASLFSVTLIEFVNAISITVSEIVPNLALY